MLRNSVLASLLAFSLVMGVPAASSFASHAHAVSSAPANDPCDHTGGDPKCDVPEAPSPLAFPIVGIAVVAAYVTVQRRRLAVRRQRRDQDSE